jgi:hypothetical protein
MVLPRWPCPTCNSGHLVAIRETLRRKETGPSARLHRDEEFFPGDAEERFSALLECNNPGCKEVATICGNIGFEESHAHDPDGEVYFTWEPFYIPRYIEPAPPVFRIPAECPKRVRVELEKSFALIWTDKESSATRMRSAVEALLDERGVPKTVISKGKRVVLTLHNRIEKYKAKDPHTAEKLLAIKWIGNIGSHTAAASQSLDDLMDAFALFANVIDTIYVREDAELHKIAQRINKHKGKRSPKKKDW